MTTKTSAGTTVVEVGRTDDGFLLRIVGRGTMRESLVLHDHVIDCLERETLGLIVDLTRCDHLDSTFLGCLVKLHKRLGGERVIVVAPAERRKLLTCMQLDKLLTITEQPPTEILCLTTITADMICSQELGRHAMQCHRELAQLGGPNQAIFERIAAQLARELGDELAGDSTGEHA